MSRNTRPHSGAPDVACVRKTFLDVPAFVPIGSTTLYETMRFDRVFCGGHKDERRETQAPRRQSFTSCVGYRSQRGGREFEPPAVHQPSLPIAREGCPP